MKFLYFLLIFIFLSNCSGNKSVYWCGDHACVNEKERIAYFKKNMMIEIKDATKSTKEDLKRKKELKKQVKIENKRNRKIEKELKKRVKLDKKIKLNEEKKSKSRTKVYNLTKKIETNNKKVIYKENTELIKDKDFNSIAKKIMDTNKSKSYPDINNVPN